MRILFQKQTPKVVCHKCPSPTVVADTTSNIFSHYGWGPNEGDCSCQFLSFLVLKSVGILPFISKVSITSSRTNPSFRPGSDCDIWQCMIQNRQGIEMAGAADGQDPITQRPFFFFHVCSQLCCFGVSLARDVQLCQERRNEVGLGSQSLVRQILENPKGILIAQLVLQMLSKYCRTLGVNKVKFFFWLHCCLVGCLSLPIYAYR